MAIGYSLWFMLHDCINYRKFQRPESPGGTRPDQRQEVSYQQETWDEYNVSNLASGFRSGAFNG